MGTRLSLLALLLVGGLALSHLWGLRPLRQVTIEGVLRRPAGPAPQVQVELQSSRRRWLVDAQGNQFTGMSTGGSEVLWVQRQDRPLSVHSEWLPGGNFRVRLQFAATVAPRRAVVLFLGAAGQEARSPACSLRPVEGQEESYTGWFGFLDLPPASTAGSQKAKAPAIASLELADEPEEVDMSETGRPTSSATETEELAVNALQKINLLPVRELLARTRAIRSQAHSPRGPLAALLEAVAVHRQQLLAHLGRSLPSSGSVPSADSATSRSMSEE